MIEQSVAVEKFRLTTAEILYHLPDFPTVLQSYIWQELDGPLHSVRVASKGIMSPVDLRYFDCSFTLH